jgi:hypothetical protein
VNRILVGTWESQAARDCALRGRIMSVFIVRTQVSVSQNLERWKELATLYLKEQIPAKLAREMNLG